MTLQRIGDWSTDDPVKLDRELTAHEDSIAAEFQSVRDTFARTATVSTRVSLPAPKPAAFALQPDEQASFDTLLGGLTGVLPALTPKNFGRRFVVLKRFAANTVSVVCQDPTVKLNAAAFPLAISAAGATVFYCDAAGYYR